MYVVVSKSKPSKVWRYIFSGAKNSTPIIFNSKKQAKRAIKTSGKKDTKIVWANHKQVATVMPKEV